MSPGSAMQWYEAEPATPGFVQWPDTCWATWSPGAGPPCAVKGEKVTSCDTGAVVVVAGEDDVVVGPVVVDVVVRWLAAELLWCVDGVPAPQADNATAASAAAASGARRLRGDCTDTVPHAGTAIGSRWTQQPGHLGQTDAMGSAGDKSRKQKRRLGKVPKYEEPNSLPAEGLTGSSGGPFGSRYGHSADHHGAEKPPGRFGAFVLRTLGMKPKS
jgi:hypothetical protein